MSRIDNEHRLFFAPEAKRLRLAAAASDRTVSLPPEESHHAVHVLRLRTGDEVRLFDGEGFFYDGRISTIRKGEVSVEIVSVEPSEREPQSRLFLTVASLKGRKSDLLVQKSVELGVGEMTLFPSERSVSRWRQAEDADAHRERWERIVVSACKQCGRATLMPVRPCRSLEEALSLLPSTGPRYVFWEEEAERIGEKQPVRTTLFSGAEPSAGGAQTKGSMTESPPDGAARPESGSTTAAGPMCALIGPEGGFTAEEIDRVRKAGFLTCSLGWRILRAETAALAAATILLRRAGDLGPPLPWD